MSAEKAALLAAMGVQVWYERPSQAAATAPAQARLATAERQTPLAPPVSAEPSTNAAPLPNTVPPPAVTTESPSEAIENVQTASGASAQPIEFIWLKGAAGMLWLPTAIDPAALQLAKDAVVFADWLRQQATSGASQGEFRWPQLLDTHGTPERSLSVFVNKHLPETGGWLAVSGEVVDQVGDWLRNLDIEFLPLPGLNGRADDVDTKKKLWQSLKQSS